MTSADFNPCFLDLFFLLVIHSVVLVLLVLALIDLTLVHVVVVVDVLPVLVVVDLLASSGLMLSTSRLLLVFVISVDSLHHNVSTLWIDPVVVVDVPLERDAEDPPLHNTCSFSEKLYILLGWHVTSED